MNGAERFNNQFFRLSHTMDDSGDPRLSDPAEAKFHEEWVAKVESEMDEERYWADREEADRLYQESLDPFRWAY